MSDCFRAAISGSSVTGFGRLPSVDVLRTGHCGVVARGGGRMGGVDPLRSFTTGRCWARESTRGVAARAELPNILEHRDAAMSVDCRP